MTPKVTSGAWSARWGAWQVYLKLSPAGWSVQVWQWPPGQPHTERVTLGKATGHDTSDAAITWACDVLKSHGAKVFIDGAFQSLEHFLFFTPAPEISDALVPR